MRIYIITMDDPIQTNAFIKRIIDERRDDIAGLAVPQGDRMTLSSGKSKYVYLLSLFLIMGPYHFFRNAFIAVRHKARKTLAGLSLVSDPAIGAYARAKGIDYRQIKSPNNKEFRDYLESLNVDVIINQSQSFLKKELLEIPRIGVLNRHNALLPKNRGRLSPFWVLYKQEKETGVSIHFVEEALDSGDIVIQKSIPVLRKDTFNTLVKRSYALASQAIIEALDKLDKGVDELLPNDDSLATYNSTPSLKEAWKYRWMLIKRSFRASR